MAYITTTQYSIAINGGLHGSITEKGGLRQGDPISPLLFVVCMEYLTRILNKVADMRKFGYHTKCRGLKLNHLCFAGLNTNAGKSNIFSANMPKQEREDLCEATGYQKESLPFRYLGGSNFSKEVINHGL
uniref:Uncharacterized mitochondrial protein AtMg01250-like n=1 Tax=Nicotiana tabacum TaxID=4097 RepID=A0A1S4BDA0_TOBAC|nr:PREDICTED: uncharacterized mitochondrial protein AtMg01250-like [Nicotiana tabacum]